MEQAKSLKAPLGDEGRLDPRSEPLKGDPEVARNPHLAERPEIGGIKGDSVADPFGAVPGTGRIGPPLG
jgi:hypothetical protein